MVLLKRQVVILIASIVFGLPGMLFAEPLFFIKSSVTLNCDNPDSSSQSIIHKVESLGGYFTRYTENNVSLKIPVSQEKVIRTYVESLGQVIGKSYHVDDMTQTIQENKTRLKAKQDMMEKYLDVLNHSKQKSIVLVEKTMIDLVEEIEALKGKIWLLEHQIHFAEMEIHFRYHDRQTPPSRGDSSFAWLNTLNLSTMIRDFYNEP